MTDPGSQRSDAAPSNADLAQSTLEEQCVAKGMRMTEQRRIIARVIEDASDHPDVEELYRRAVQNDPRISISTVYRTVKLFEDAGIIERHDFRDGRARYETVPEEHHDHLIDLKSGRVIEFRNEEIEHLQEAIARTLGYRLVDHRLELYGVPLGPKDRIDRMMRVRAAAVLAILTLVTLPLIPVQWLALRSRGPVKRRLPVIWHRIACAVVGIKVREIGRPATGRPLLITANHVSWLDITVLGSRMPLSFVAKTEVASWPVFGLFAKLQRSVFVDRQRRSATARTAEELGTRLAEGDAMVLFAEGTSNSGNEVLPFRSALIGAARHAVAGDDGDVWIQPLALAYTRLHGLPMGRQFRNHVAWYGDMEMIPHFMNVVRQGAVDVTVVWGEPVRAAPGGDRKALTRTLEGEVRRLAGAARAERLDSVPAGPMRATAAHAILKSDENG